MTAAFGYIMSPRKGKQRMESLARQRRAIREFAKANGFRLAHIYEESGQSSDLSDRTTLAEMLVDLGEEGQGVRAVIVERLIWLAWDLIFQEAIIQDLMSSGVNLISTRESVQALGRDPTRMVIRQALEVLAEYEKTMFIQKLRVARQRKKDRTGKCEGRKSYKEAAPGTVGYIRRLRRKPKGMKRRSYRQIAEQLNAENVPTLNGQPWTLQTVRHALQR